MRTTSMAIEEARGGIISTSLRCVCQNARGVTETRKRHAWHGGQCLGCGVTRQQLQRINRERVLEFRAWARERARERRARFAMRGGAE